MGACSIPPRVIVRIILKLKKILFGPTHAVLKFDTKRYQQKKNRECNMESISTKIYYFS